MAKILYSVAGEGLGHAVRSSVVIKELSKSHKIRIFAAGKSYFYLKNLFDVEKIDYFKILYWRNKALRLVTLIFNILKFPIILKNSWKLNRIIKNFKPDVIITDFEPIVTYFAYFRKIPLISIDNQSIISEISYKGIPRKYWMDAFLTKLLVSFFIIKPRRKFINSFFDMQIKHKNSFLVKPLLRKEIVNAKPTVKEYVLVYQTSKSNKKLLKELQKINENFVVYGFYENRNIGNIKLKDSEEKEFYKDLNSCKAVIANGGFNLISEALYLKKPVLSIPINGQFEQIVNAFYLEKLGYGMFARKTSKEVIKRFIGNIPIYRKRLKSYKIYQNKEALGKINDILPKYNRKAKLFEVR